MKTLRVLLVIAIVLCSYSMLFAENDPKVVTDTAERMSYSILRVIMLAIPIAYFMGVSIASVIFAFRSYNRAKNDQVESPGKVAATTALITALVGFGGGGVLFLAADKWIFNGQFFSNLSTLLAKMVGGQ